MSSSKVKDSFHSRSVHSRQGLRYVILSAFDACQGWIAAAVIGVLTACVAFCVDVAVATVSDWKLGYCRSNMFANRESCCKKKSPLTPLANLGENCDTWHAWTTNYTASFAIYTGFALAFGIISSSLTMLTKRLLPATAPGLGDKQLQSTSKDQGVVGKSHGSLHNGFQNIAKTDESCGKCWRLVVHLACPWHLVLQSVGCYLAMRLVSQFYEMWVQIYEAQMPLSMRS